MAILSAVGLGADVADIACLRFHPRRVQRLYGRHLNHDGKVKIQSSPRTFKGGGESRSGKKPRVAGSNPAGR